MRLYPSAFPQTRKFDFVCRWLYNTRHSGHNPSFLNGWRERGIYFGIYLAWFGIQCSLGTTLNPTLI